MGAFGFGGTVASCPSWSAGQGARRRMLILYSPPNPNAPHRHQLVESEGYLCYTEPRKNTPPKIINLNYLRDHPGASQPRIMEDLGMTSKNHLQKCPDVGREKGLIRHRGGRGRMSRRYGLVEEEKSN
jgi:hypothetical protein